MSLYILQLRERSIALATPTCSKRLQKSASKKLIAHPMCPICGSRTRKFEVNGNGLLIALLDFEIRDIGEKRDPSLVCRDFLASQHPFPVEKRKGRFIREVREVATIIVLGIKKGKSKVLPIILRSKRKLRGIHTCTIIGPCTNDLDVCRMILGIITSNHLRTWRRI